MHSAPEEVINLINQYLSLEFGSKKVRTPYFINIKHARAELRSLIGKGLPEEIKEETMIYAKLRGFNLEKSTSHEIRTFMMEQGIGVDCSGFVSHLLDTWTKGKFKSQIKYPKESIYRKIIRSLRPIENIDANLLTNTENTEAIDFEDAQPGDLIRLKGLEQGDHVAIIIKREGNLLEYAHSTQHYGEENGVRIGVIEIKDKKQEWKELDKDGISWTEKQYLKDKDDNGIRRPNFFVKE